MGSKRHDGSESMSSVADGRKKQTLSEAGGLYR
jgi:hypothetical protein